MKNMINKSVGEIVAGDYRLAGIFRSHGIDYCCNGNIPLAQACQNQNIEPETVVAEIEEMNTRAVSADTNYQSWPIDLLADYIEKKHHRYVEEKIPEIRQLLEKVCEVHGENHPELLEITKLFNTAGGELAKHMKKEELVLFPFIRKMMNAKAVGESLTTPFFGEVQNPLQTMIHEHDNEGERFRKISQLSNGYTPPEDACVTFQLTYQALKEFEEDLHLHVHLENNILFPKTLRLEEELKQR